MSLCESEQNSTYRIKQMNFELDETGAGKRLEALGLKKGTIVTVISKKKQGGVIIDAEGNHIALCRSFASAIDVEEKEAV